jgi:hypothetical protein
VGRIGAVSDPTEWYWCLRHGRAVTADEACPPDQRMGPYATRDEAEHWQDKVAARNDAWDASDRAWGGDE